jgi:hypothetical protein
MPETFNPLTPQLAEIVRQGCAECTGFGEYLEQLEKAGIDTAKWREAHAGFAHLFTTVRAQWLPGELT